MTKKFLHAILRNDFPTFVRKTFQTVDGSQKFIPCPFIELIADKLTQCMEGKIKRLIINVPPRSLKSTIVSIAFPAYLLGKNPGDRILCISYSDELAGKFSRDCRTVMESSWYKETFPKTRINPNKRSEGEFETTQNGSRIAVSMGGSLTGRGGNWIILDDPQKPEDVLSETKRNTSNQLFDSTIYSRLNNKEEGVIIIVTQRLHIDDLTAYVQKYGHWEILSIPAIAEKDEEYILSTGKKITRNKGEVLNEKLESYDSLMKLKEASGNYYFSTQYQQQPIPVKGNIIDYEKFQLYDTLPSDGRQRVVQSWDIAVTDNKNSNYSVCITAMIVNDLFYIIDIYREKLTFNNLLKQIENLKNKYKPDSIIVEDTVVSKGLIDQLRAAHIYPIPFKPEGSKEERASIQTPVIESGRVFLPQKAPWLDAFKTEVISFPCGRHDDQVDALTQLLANKPIITYSNINLDLSGLTCENKWPLFEH